MKDKQHGVETSTFRKDLAAKAAAGQAALPTQLASEWKPDRATLQWLLHRIDASSVAQAMKVDVAARQASSRDRSDDSMWLFAADAAVEAIVLPAIRETGD